MITIHHLGVSQSDRIVWLMEELGLAYELKWYHRNRDDNLAPDDYLALHPAATAPLITDNGKVYAESAVIVEHICHRHGGGRLTVSPNQSNYEDYLYWMHLNNNLLGLFFARMALGAGVDSPASKQLERLINRRDKGYHVYLNKRLGDVEYLAGEEFTCADIMVVFNLTSLPLFGGRAIDDLSNITAYVRRISDRPAFMRAMEMAGPNARPPQK